MKRSIQREQIFKILFRAEFNDVSEMPRQEEMYFDSGDMEFTEKDRQYITAKVNRILEKCPEIDEMLAAKMRGWTLERVGRVELAILRLGVYEILWDKDVPEGVAISEAVELAKKFGAENSGTFVNGVLAVFAKKD
jgi:transcription antitermination protein NusB